MGEVIVITSGKGGVGKTTLCANLGAGLALSGKKTIMIDMDLGLRNLDIVAGLENRVIYNLIDILDGKCGTDRARIQDKRFGELYLIPASQTKDNSAADPKKMSDLIDLLKKDYDMILIDCPAGIDQGFFNAVALADRAIVVTSPESASVRDADKVISLLETSGIRDIGLILNRIRPSLVKSGDMMALADVTDLLSPPVIGAVIDDPAVIAAGNNGEILAGKDTSVGRELLDICRRICGEEIPLSYPVEKRSLRDRFRYFFGR